jgi:hypothetical protein
MDQSDFGRRRLGENRACLLWEALQTKPVYFVQGNGVLGQGVSRVENLHDVTKVADGSIVPIPDFQLKTFESNVLTFDSINGWDQILPNTIGALDSICKLDNYDYIIRTNLSSYWNLEATINLVNKLPREGVFAGPIQEVNGLQWVEGDAIIFSKDVIQKLLQNRGLIDSRIIDDVSIALTLKKLGVLPMDIPRPWVRIHFKRVALSFYQNNKTQFRQYVRFHFPDILTLGANVRCKNPHKILRYSVRMDPIIFVILKIAIVLKKRSTRKS